MWVFAQRLRVTRDYGKDNDGLDVPEDKALAMVRRVLDEGVDVGVLVSYGRPNHGVTSAFTLLMRW